MLAEKSFDTGEVMLNYAEGPNNGPPILLIHGITSNWRNFLPVMPYLLLRYHVYAIDLRGHGKSGRIPGHYTLRDYEKDTKVFIEQVVKEPPILFGHSLGGMIATMYAANNQHKEAVIIGDSPPNYDNSLSADIEFRMSLWRQAKRIAETETSVAGIMSILKDEKVMWGDVPIEDPILLRSMATNWSRMDPDILSMMVEGSEAHKRGFDGYDTGLLFPMLQCPVMLIRGNPKLGGAISDSQVEKTKELIPDLTYVYMPDIGHALFPVGAEPVLSKLTIFLESLR